ncbi:M4 family metallopeptidase [Streptomyces sp. NPDC004749]
MTNTSRTTSSTANSASTGASSPYASRPFRPGRIAVLAAATVAALFVSALPASAAPAPTGDGSPSAATEAARQRLVAAEPRPGARSVGLSPAQRAKSLRAAAGTGPATARALGLGDQEKLLPKDVVKDADGTVHTRYERTYAGLPVLGGDLVVHARPGDRTPTVSRTTDASVAVPTTTATVPAAAARKTALATAKADGTTETAADGAPRRVVWAEDGAATLAWESVVNGVREDGTPSELHVVTDARSGKKLAEFDRVHTGVGHGQFNGKVQVGTVRNGDVFELTDPQGGNHSTYDLDNTNSSGTGALVTDADDVWGDGTVADRQTAAVDAAYGARKTYDFYHDRFGRDGIAGDGIGAYSRVHYGTQYVNAFWSDACFCMTYGDGAGDANPLTELDVAAHEMSHGVTSVTADLIYSGESGGLNEGTSDIMAAAVEFFADNPSDVPDYTVGELIDINGDGTPLRYMDQPSKDGVSQDYWTPGTASLDPHYSSGVANHFFYLLAEGSGTKSVEGVAYDSPTYDDLPVPGIGLHNAINVWYRALTLYMTSGTDYADARTATLQAAADLFGRSSEVYETVGDTWAAVNVGERFVDHIAFATPAAQEAAVGQPASFRVTATTSRASGLTYEATDLPAGLTLDAATGLITGIPEEAGAHTPTITARTADSSLSRTFSWTVIPSGGDFFVNPGNVPIPDADPAGAESPLIVTGRDGNAPSDLQVTVDIVHTWRGDLAIDLVGPDGTVVRRLKAPDSSSADDVHETYTVDASALPADGTWKLRVTDVYARDTGYIDSWKLTF